MIYLIKKELERFLHIKVKTNSHRLTSITEYDEYRKKRNKLKSL